MKKCFFILTFFIATIAAFPQMFSTQLGVDFFNYDKGFLDFRLAYHQNLAESMELKLGADIGINTTQRGGEIVADFLLTGEIGLVFLFPASQSLIPYVGVGLSPQFVIAEPAFFYLGPYLDAGLRIKVHPNMDLITELKQELPVGPPAWINNCTRISAGIIFHF
ncbi:hypothetical protein WKV44_01250 [Spirochaetia bacterium 38H-sp]|uniref:Outer membrane protein beta-barrel domain-containing protein n=1 Tax=Rarispira pelagica TaxID=3141764 RepID=A0ABU9U925_9SPIR